MLIRFARRFARRHDGLAAVEFALISPVLFLLFFGGIQLTDALVCNQKVTGLASTAADLVAQEQSIGTTGINNVFAAISSIVYPYPTTGIKIAITSLGYKTDTTATVLWSKANPGGTARAQNAVMAVPSGVIPSGSSVILAEVSYPYVSPIGRIGNGWLLPGTTYMNTAFYSRPRRSVQVTWTN